MMAAGSSSLSNLTSTMQTLSCMKNVREILPPSFSLHSIDLLDLDPNEAHPKMMSVTLRTLNNDRAFENRRYFTSDKLCQTIHSLYDLFVFLLSLF